MPPLHRNEVLLKANQRSSVGNEGDPPIDLEHFLTMLNINLQDRIKKQKEEKGKKKPRTIDIRTREQRLRGLFGGDRKK